MPKTLVIDGNNCLIRTIMATRGVRHETAYLHAFIGMVAKYVRRESPTHLAVCWDDGTAHRRSIDPNYKSGNRGGGREFSDQFGAAKKFLALAGVFQITVTGAEADDIIAGLWATRDKASPFVILSGDKDFLQLLDTNCSMIRLGDANDTWTAERLLRERGYEPKHLSLVMSLSGDAGDGVPGIPGIGTKTAVRLLREYDWDFDAFVESGHPKIIGQEDLARTTQWLVDLRHYAQPLELQPLPPFEPTGPDNMLWDDLMAFVKRHGLQDFEPILSGGRMWG